MKNQQWKGDPSIAIQLHAIEATLKCQNQDALEIKECYNWFEGAKKVFQQRVFGFLPYDRYDKIWTALQQIRHVYCRILSLSDLLAVALDIRGSLTYIPKEEVRETHEKELTLIEALLKQHITGYKPDKPPSHTEQEIRYHLERLSRIGADARQTHWRKVNLLRTRLLLTAPILGALLVGSIFLIPEFLLTLGITRLHILAVISLGTIGGLVSALQTVESMEASSSSYYIQRTLLGLRPVVGAAAGLIVYLIHFSGVVSIVPAATYPQVVYLVLAFGAGFTERFFVAQIGRITDMGKEEKKPSGTP